MPRYDQLEQRNYRVVDEHYALVPKADIPRSTFHRRHELKTTGPAGNLIPILCNEVLPGDVHTGHVTIFARLSTLLFPLMDNAQVDTQFFFIPARILWESWKKFMGEQTNPTDSISYAMPTVPCEGRADAFSAGVATAMLQDYMGVPIANFVGNTKDVNALPFRAYNLIFNEWYRDQNLQTSLIVSLADAPDDPAWYELRRRNKRHDYFTSALPWPQKQVDPIQIPLNGIAPVKGIGFDSGGTPFVGPANVNETLGTASVNYPFFFRSQSGPQTFFLAEDGSLGASPSIFADLSQATGATINALRLAVQTQKLLERDARGGTRYTELLQMHFGVHPQDARVQRPEYIGGGTTYIQTAAIAQTAETGTTPLGGLAGQATVAGAHHFTLVAAEHGYIIGLLSLMTKPTYQEGLARMFTRSTRYDFAWPEFTALGEQSIRNDEIYTQATAADNQTFGYQERYSEYRFEPNRVSGLFRTKNTNSISEWHLAQSFSSLPTLGTTFITENAPWARVFAAGTAVARMAFLADILFDVKTTRPLPAYGIPGGQMGTF